MGYKTHWKWATSSSHAYFEDETKTGEIQQQQALQYLSRAGLENLSLLHSKQYCWKCEWKRKPYGFAWRRGKLSDWGVQSKSDAFSDCLPKRLTLVRWCSTRKPLIRDTPAWGAGGITGIVSGRSCRQSTPEELIQSDCTMGNFKPPKGTEICAPSLRQQARKMQVQPSWCWDVLNPG